MTRKKRTATEVSLDRILLLHALGQPLRGPEPDAITIIDLARIQFLQDRGRQKEFYEALVRAIDAGDVVPHGKDKPAKNWDPRDFGLPRDPNLMVHTLNRENLSEALRFLGRLPFSLLGAWMGGAWNGPVWSSRGKTIVVLNKESKVAVQRALAQAGSTSSSRKDEDLGRRERQRRKSFGKERAKDQREHWELIWKKWRSTGRAILKEHKRCEFDRPWCKRHDMKREPVPWSLAAAVLDRIPIDSKYRCGQKAIARQMKELLDITREVSTDLCE